MIVKSKVREDLDGSKTEYKTVYIEDVPVAQIVFNGKYWVVTELKSAKASVLESEQEALSAISELKDQEGQFSAENTTEHNPFDHTAFSDWADRNNLRSEEILEPFAGSNNIIKTLIGMGLCSRFRSYDHQPGDDDVLPRNTLEDFPTGFKVCVSHPPWLAIKKATRSKLALPNGEHQDLYQFCLEQCLDHCEAVALLLPESFIRTGLFRSRLSAFISLTYESFQDTAHPVALALFDKEDSKDVHIWSSDRYVGKLTELEALRPLLIPLGQRVEFNVPDGNVGLIALDNTTEASIRFCSVEELGDYEVKASSRMITKLSVEKPNIDGWNRYIEEIRDKSSDVILTAYRGLREDGKYRRRLDYGFARSIIQNI